MSCSSSTLSLRWLVLMTTLSLVTSTELTTDDVFIAVKTSSKFHKTRLNLILRTWDELAKVWYFTDKTKWVDAWLLDRTEGRLVSTECSDSHERSALCCKMQAEMDFFKKNVEKHRWQWFCHFDDDNYVNIPALLSALSTMDPSSSVYVGKSSVSEPMQVTESGKSVSFSFATGGAGFCLSGRVMADMAKMGKRVDVRLVGDRIHMPDDVTVGFIVNHLLKVPLTTLNTFHSHLEHLKLIPLHQLANQVTLSYGWIRSRRGSSFSSELNTVALDSVDEEDDARFVAIHCHIFPAKCLRAKRSN